MGHTTLWFSHPRRFGPGSRQCRVCANTHGVIRKYSLFMCRRCFREYSNDIGFKKIFRRYQFETLLDDLINFEHRKFKFQQVTTVRQLKSNRGKYGPELIQFVLNGLTNG